MREKVKGVKTMGISDAKKRRVRKGFEMMSRGKSG